MSFEIFFRAIKHDLKTPFLASVAAVHYTLNRLDFSCLQVNKSFKELFLHSNHLVSAGSSQLLPSHWSSFQQRICMLYHHPESDLHFVVQMFDFGHYALAHLMRIDGDSLADIDLPYSCHFGDDLSSYKEGFKDPERLFEEIEKNLLRPILNHVKNSLQKVEKLQEVRCS